MKYTLLLLIFFLICLAGIVFSVIFNLELNKMDIHQCQVHTILNDNVNNFIIKIKMIIDDEIKITYAPSNLIYNNNTVYHCNRITDDIYFYTFIDQNTLNILSIVNFITFASLIQLSIIIYYKYINSRHNRKHTNDKMSLSYGSS